MLEFRPKLDVSQYLTVCRIVSDGIRQGFHCAGVNDAVMQHALLKDGWILDEFRPDLHSILSSEFDAVERIATCFVIDAIGRGCTERSEIHKYVARHYRMPQGGFAGPDLIERGICGFLTLEVGELGTFLPKAAVVPTSAVVACAGTVVSTILNPMSAAGWAVLGIVVIATLKAARQPLSVKEAQVLAELYLTTNSARRKGCSTAHLLANLNVDLERARQPLINPESLDEIVKDLASRKVVKFADTFVSWGMLTIEGYSR